MNLSFQSDSNLRHFLERANSFFWIRFALLSIAVTTLQWSWNSGAIQNGPIFCTFRLVTGIPCPFCGSTRAAAAISAGDILPALQLNSIGAISFVALCWFYVFPKSRIPIQNKFRKLMPITQGILTFFLLLALLTSWAIRLNS